MPLYKLSYFDAKGRAEPVRLLFAYAEVDYEDVRVKYEDWPKLKPTTPTEVLPILEVVDEKGKSTVIAQSQAIARYVARELNLAGSNNLEAAQCEMSMETLVDIGADLGPVFAEEDEAKKAELKKSIFEEKIKKRLKYIEDMIANEGDFFVGNKITVADINFFGRNEFFHSFLGLDPLKDFPKLTALKKKVSQEPKIAAWLAKRPESSW